MSVLFYADTYFINQLKRLKDLWIMTKRKNTGSMQEFLNKFFDLCKEYQEQIPPHKIAEVLRDYAERLDGWTKRTKRFFKEIW